jgi:thiamine-phosphate pyrophosphorylase
VSLRLCLVTDRGRRDPIEQAREAVAAGVDLIQVRERDLEAGALAAIVRELVGVARRGPTRVVVNDRLDVALACGAHGVHLRGDSMPARSVRSTAPAGFLVGRSVHAIDEVRDAGPVDYVIAGTVYRTPSKGEEAPLIGLEGLRAITGAAVVPVFAIGGVTIDTIGALAAAGAAGVAGIGLFAAAGAPASVVEAARRFDTAKTAP